MRSLYAYEEMIDVRMLMYVVEIYWQKRKEKPTKADLFILCFSSNGHHLLIITPLGNY